MLTTFVHNTRLLQFAHFYFIMIHRRILFLDAKHSELPLLQNSFFFLLPPKRSMAMLARNPILEIVISFNYTPQGTSQTVTMHRKDIRRINNY